MTTLADLKPGDRVTIYGDVKAEILRVEDRTYEGDTEEWVSVRYRALSTGLVGTFVWLASVVLPIPVGTGEST